MAFKSTDFKGHICNLQEKASDMNIKFSYRYRDYANYKKYNEVVFSNPSINEADEKPTTEITIDQFFERIEEAVNGWKL